MRRCVLASGFLTVFIICSSCTSSKIDGGPIPSDRLLDGVYRGSARNGPVKVIVDVTIKDKRVAEVDLVKHRTWKGGAAAKKIPGLIIEQQSTHVDAVTGATVSSCAIMHAVQNAVEKALK